jgi:hypothetical protein
VAAQVQNLSSCAADLLVKAPAPATATDDWSGFYLGAYGGGGWGPDRGASLLLIFSDHFFPGGFYRTIGSSPCLAAMARSALWYFG